MGGEHFKSRLREGASVIANKGLVKALKGDGTFTIFLVDLMDKDNYFSKKREGRYDGWFFSTKAYRSEEYGMSDYTLKRLMKKAVDLGLVTTKQQGSPPKQWIKINYDKLEQLVYGELETHPANQLETHPANQLETHPVLYNKTTNSPNINNTLSDQQNNNLPKRTGRGKAAPILSSVQVKTLSLNPPEAKPLASYLANIIISHINIKIPPQKIGCWVGEITYMILKDEIAPGRIKKALDWYKDNIGIKYTPVIQSGATLRQKFAALEAAVKRGEENGSRRKPSQSSHEKPDNEKFMKSIQHKIV